MKYQYEYSYGWTNRNIRLYDFTNKEKSVREYGQYMLDRTQQMFKWTGLPDTIPQRNLELILQTCGHCVIVKDNDKQYAVIGGFGGEPNVYYEPTLYVVANPALPNLKPTWTINEDCVLIRNDSCMIGLNPLFSRYCSLLVENDISFRLANINTRISNLISAQDDRTLKSALKFIKDVEDGKLGIISSSQFFEGLQVENTTRGYSGVLKDLIEYHQYIRASLYNEIGVDANYNMKRTFVNKAEVEANEDALFPLIDDLLEQRKNAVEIWNDLFDMNISVEFNSIWYSNHESEKLSIKAAKVENENTEADTENIQADTDTIINGNSDVKENKEGIYEETDNLDSNVSNENEEKNKNNINSENVGYENKEHNNNSISSENDEQSDEQSNEIHMIFSEQPENITIEINKVGENDVSFDGVPVRDEGESSLQSMEDEDK